MKRYNRSKQHHVIIYLDNYCLQNIVTHNEVILEFDCTCCSWIIYMQNAKIDCVLMKLHALAPKIPTREISSKNALHWGQGEMKGH